MDVTLNNGDLLEGRYRVVERIGEGGMGVVYRAEHVILHRPCAVKVLHPSEAGDETMLKRFKIEAQAAANVRHPNIVEVMDFGLTPANLPFFVMEHLEGESLADRMERTGKQSVETAHHILKQILKGLNTAHRRGIIHRDLKPENVFMAHDGSEEVVKLLDFGISKIVGGTPSRPPVPVTGKHRALTQKGMIFGTPGYMAPETLFGAETVDGRADLFSVAVMLYELLVGERPFQGGDPHSTMMATASQETPRARDKVPSVPPAVEIILQKGLEKDPARRFQSAAEFSDALTRAVQAPERRTRSAPENTIVDPPRPDVADAPRAPEMEIEREPLAVQTARLAMDGDHLAPSPRTKPRPRYMSLVPVARKGRFGGGRRRISIAFSPIPILFFLALGGGVYYYFIHRAPMHTVADVDPIAREMARRRDQNSVQAAAPVAPSVPLEMVELTIDATPKHVKVLWNGEIKYERPIIVPKGDNLGELTFRAPGYREGKTLVVPNQEQTVTVRLKKIRRRKKAPR